MRSDPSSRRLFSAWLFLVACLLCLSPLRVIASPPSTTESDPGPMRMPPHPSVLASIRAQGFDSVTVLNLNRLERLARERGVNSPEQISAPALGARPALVLLVEFSDLTHDAVSTPSFYTNMLFSVGTYPAPGSMRDFYREVSYGLFDLSPTLVDSAWRQTGRLHTYYANADGISGTSDDYGFGTYPQDAIGLVVDAVTLADPYVDFSSFATNGEVKGLFVVHAGRGAETDPTHADWIWSHKWELNTKAMTVDGVLVNNYTMEPEYNFSPGDSTAGVFCHEYGHVLGLPDLYDTDNSSQGLGGWSLMAGGSWNGPGFDGSSPAHPDAWSRAYLGWVAPTTVTTTLVGASIPRAEDHATSYELTNPLMPAGQYFLVENRQKVGFDAYLPGAGLLIYHVDDTKTNNDSEWYPGHTVFGNYWVAMEQADGLWELEKNLDSGDTGDPWPGRLNKTAFNNDSIPDSKTYTSQATGIGVASISASADVMTATLSSGALPNAPTSLAATAVSDTQINLVWLDNSSDETGFKIERKTGVSGTWAEIATVAANTASYQNTGLTAVTTYYYRVRAYGYGGDSSYSNESGAATYALLGPSSLTATPGGVAQINLVWTDHSSNETGFKIERKTGTGGTWSQIATVASGVTIYASTGLAWNTNYYYRVRSYNGSGDSAYSNEANATTYALPAPNTLTATAASASQINLSWKDNSSTEDGFKIERQTGGAAFAEIATVAPNTTTYQNTGLNQGTAYTYRVRSYNASGYSMYSNQASATTLSPPAAPSGLTATPGGVAQINLVWTDNSTNETGFKIERKTGAGGTWSQIATVAAGVTAYASTGLAWNTNYYYRVRAYNADGNSAYSNEANATTYALPAPNTLTATAVSPSQINLSWRDNSSTEDGFKIERQTGTGVFAEIATVAPNTITYQDTGLPSGTTYTYRLRAYTASGYSMYSNQASATTLSPPATPTSLTAVPGGVAQINLAWTDNSSNETGFKIERKTGISGTWSQIATVAAGVTAYASTGLAWNTNYYYRVRAYNADGDSAYSNEANATTYALPAPNTLIATAASPTQINLSWRDNSSTEDGFKIERQSGAGAFAEIATVAPNTTTYQNTGLIPGTTYAYRLRAYNAGGYSMYSNQASATTPTLPAAPTGLTATPGGVAQINLVWTDNSGNETGFKIERKTGISGTWSQITTTAAGVTAYASTGLAWNTNYYYRVRAYNADGDSAYSNEANATTYALPAPNTLTATAISVSQIDLSWKDNSATEDGFKIERQRWTGVFAEIATVPANTTTYQDSGTLDLGTTYTYRVRAYNASGYSMYSYPTSASTLSITTGPQLMPPHRDALAQIRAKGYDSVTFVDLKHLQEMKASGSNAPRQIRAPAVGNRPALVLLVEFPDLAHNAVSTPAFFNDMLFSVGTYPAPGSMRDYFREASYGLLDLTPTLVDSAWRQVSHPHNYYADADGVAGTGDEYGLGDSPNSARGLVADAVALADPYVDFSSFAKDGAVENLFIVHAGRGAETDPSHRDWIWSHQWIIVSPPVDGVRIYNYSMEPEYNWLPGDSTIGVFCNGYGHVLGLPDLYDGDTSSQGLGDWSVMATGSWNGPGHNGSSPAHPDAWSKARLGWANPTSVVGTMVGASLPRAEDNAVSYKLTNPQMPAENYFLVENRQQTGFDSYLPGAGLLIYHVDDTRWSNSGEWYPGFPGDPLLNHYWVALEQADGLWQLDRRLPPSNTGNYGDPADPWPGSLNKTAFNDSSTPDSKTWDSVSTGIGITSISASADVMTATLSSGALPNAPTSLAATAVSDTQINLVWLDNSSDETGFKIERKTGVSGTWAEIATVAANTASYQNTGLTAVTTYYYRVRAYGYGGDSSYSNESGAATYALLGPSSLTALPGGVAQINLVWTDNSTNETGFKIERKTGISGTWSQITTVAAGVTSYASTGLAWNTNYYYRVRAYNADGDSAYSNEANATTYALPAPNTLTAAAVSGSQINLSWKDNSSTEDGFKIERQTGTGVFSEIATVAPNTITYQDTGLTSGTAFTYRLRAYNASGYSMYSNQASATTLSLPAAPSSLTALPGGVAQINLAWTDNSSDETGFKIERKTGISGTWSQITTVAAGATSYVNTGLSYNTTYYYRLRAYNGNGDSAYSNEANATTYALPAPNTLTATTASPTQINLTWRDNSSTEDGFKIERQTGTGVFAEIATVAPNTITYQDTGLTSGTTYTYRLRAYTASGYSMYSNQASATTPVVPAAPSSLTAIPGGVAQINLAWTDNSTDETGFKIERKTGISGTWSQITTVAAGATVYINTGLSWNTLYYYRVRAYNANGDSSYSNEANATTYALPAPNTLTATAASASQINLSWRDNSSTEDGFKIERQSGTGGFAEIATVAPNTTTYQNTGLNPSTAYTYRVRAYTASGYSMYSNQASATTPVVPVGPSSLTAIPGGVAQVNLAWTDNSSDETGFKIERKTGAGGTWSQVATVGADIRTYINTGLSWNTLYYYRVRAYNANGDSAYSNEAYAITYALPAPNTLTATAISATQINLSWKDNSSTETGFRIERMIGAGSWTEIAIVGLDVTTYSNTGLTPSATYSYRVRAFNGSGYSMYSNQASATTPAASSPR